MGKGLQGLGQKHDQQRADHKQAEDQGKAQDIAPANLPVTPTEPEIQGPDPPNARDDGQKDGPLRQMMDS
jgi:hypothetical protein